MPGTFSDSLSLLSIILFYNFSHVGNFFHSRITSLTPANSQSSCFIIPGKLCCCISTVFKIVVISLILINSELAVFTWIYHKFHRLLRFLGCINKSFCNRKDTSCFYKDRHPVDRSIYGYVLAAFILLVCPVIVPFRTCREIAFPCFLSMELSTLRSVIHRLCNRRSARVRW